MLPTPRAWPGESSRGHARNRFRAVVDFCLDFLELPARGRGLAALPVHRSRELLLQARERAIDHIPMQDFLLQAGEQLLFESTARDEQIVFANAIAAVSVHRTAVARIAARFPLPGNDGDASTTARTLEKAGEEIG